MAFIPAYQPYGTAFNLTGAPIVTAGFDRVLSIPELSAFAERQDYSWYAGFVPRMLAPVTPYEATFLDWYDPFSATDFIAAPKGLRNRSINQFPVVNLADSEANGQATAELFAGTGAGVSGACAIQQAKAGVMPANFTAFGLFKYKQAASNNVIKTLLSGNKAGGTTGVWLFYKRISSTVDEWTFSPNQAGGATVSSIQLPKLDEDSFHTISVSMTAGLVSEMMLDGVVINSFTHSIGIDTATSTFMNYGCLNNGTSPLVSKIGPWALSNIAMSQRVGGVLVQKDMLTRLHRKQMRVFGIAA